MNSIDITNELNSEEYKKEWERLVEMRTAIIYCLTYSYMNASRDGISGDQNFFLRMIDDILQSVGSIEVTAKEGILNTCRRELRYLVEVSIKSCVIVQSAPNKTFNEQIAKYEDLLNSSNISPINLINFYYLKESGDEFKTHVKRKYGYLCKYVHSSVHQIQERLRRVQAGRTIGFEGIQELTQLNNDVQEVFAIVLVMIFHAVAPYVVGDFFVERNGNTIEWYFTKSKYISQIDEYFDYKSERQSRLSKIKEDRASRICF